MTDMPKILVLRLGHRRERDKRVSTHCCLVARAFGAESLIYTGERDANMEKTVKKVIEKWGGKFSVRYENNWRKFVKRWKGLRIHLTMYGLPLAAISKIRKLKKPLLIIIGSEKVPAEIYSLADYNISVTSQPHSEVAALAVFLHEFFSGKEINKKFRKAKLRIVPQEKGKKVLKLS